MMRPLTLSRAFAVVLLILSWARPAEGRNVLELRRLGFLGVGPEANPGAMDAHGPRRRRLRLVNRLRRRFPKQPTMQPLVLGRRGGGGGGSPKMHSAPASSRVGLAKVVKAFGPLGFLAFGGGYFAVLQRQLATNSDWISPRAYMELFSVLQGVPGPTSIQLVFCTAACRSGIIGGFVAILLWSIPSTFMILWAGYHYSAALGDPPAWIRGIVPAMLAVTVKAVVGMVSSHLDGCQLFIAMASSIVVTVTKGKILPNARSSTSIAFLYPLLLVLGGCLTFLEDLGSRPSVIGAQGYNAKVSASRYRLKESHPTVLPPTPIKRPGERVLADNSLDELQQALLEDIDMDDEERWGRALDLGAASVLQGKLLGGSEAQHAKYTRQVQQQRNQDVMVESIIKLPVMIMFFVWAARRYTNMKQRLYPSLHEETSVSEHRHEKQHRWIHESRGGGEAAVTEFFKSIEFKPWTAVVPLVAWALLYSWTMIMAGPANGFVKRLFAISFRLGSSMVGVGPGVPHLASEFIHTIVSESQFFQGVKTVEKIVPGATSCVALATYIGARQGHWKGAIAAYVGIALPGVLFACSLLPLWSRYREQEWFLSVSRGFTAVSAGLLIAACLTMYSSGIQRTTDVLILLICGIILMVRDVPIPMVMLLGAILGMVL